MNAVDRPMTVSPEHVTRARELLVSFHAASDLDSMLYASGQMVGLVQALLDAHDLHLLGEVAS